MKVSGSGSTLPPITHPAVFPIHGHKNQLSRPGLFYVLPNLSTTYPERQRSQYAQYISHCFSEMVKNEPAESGFWTTRGTQVGLYKEVLANGNYRILEKDGQVAGILIFKVYEKGPEAEDRVIKLINEAVDRRTVNPAEFEEFINEFCKEVKLDLGTKIVISQEKKGDTYLARILRSVGFKEVDVNNEAGEYRSYSTSYKYAIYKKEL